MKYLCVIFFFFFFFQAEDGIRDHCVTGVQTCALPISIIYDKSYGSNLHNNNAVFLRLFIHISSIVHEHLVVASMRNRKL